MSDDKDVKKILVIRFSSLGDIILTTALYPNLKAKWPDAEIYVLTKKAFASILKDNPHVDHIRIYDPEGQKFSDLTSELRKEAFDVVIDLHGNIRSWIIRLLTSSPRTLVVNKETWARRFLVWFKWKSEKLERSVRERILDCLSPLGIEAKHQETELYPRNVDLILKTYGIDTKKRLIGIAPGAKHNTKRWGADNFSEAANRLGAIPDTEILILGDHADKSVAKSISHGIHVPCQNLVGWTTLPELVALVSKLDLLITNDSGLMHIGEALNIPLVTIFGPTVRGFGFAPYRETSRVAEVVNLRCRPCSLHGDEKCPLKHHRCMTDIDVNAVLLTASHLLEKGAKPVAPPPEGSLEDFIAQ